MNNITGPPVEGDNFYGREPEIDYAWGRISTGNNLILPSPRRVGKTSFALKLLDIAKREGWDTISINLERITSEQAFIERFVEELRKLSWWDQASTQIINFLSLFKQLKPSFKYGDVEMELSWEENKIDIYKQLADILDHRKPTLIFFDELTVLLNVILNADENGKRNVSAFLHWLRSLRIVGRSRIKWIYCSSVGIENFTHQHGISDTMNDISDYRLKSFSHNESIGMLLNLGRSNNLDVTKEIAKDVVGLLDYCLPFFLQIMFDKLNYLVNIENVPIDRKISQYAYAQIITENHFNTWIERIENQYGYQKKYVFALLKLTCQDKSGVSRANLINATTASGLDIDDAEEIVRKLIYMLKNDGYLVEDNGLYRFRSPLLRDFWFERFVR
ncbi:hypothetical protein ACFQZS_00310 [Mucilaginibacter calamicampi]|uniref:ATPase domain-containing protein n=1 Tax=Mucilaginibacter calamicampi TaxID=1302352 RepID=A0ABW2YVU8_9SPHI